MAGVAGSGDDGRVRLGWLLLGRWDRGLPERRAFPKDEAQRIWQRASWWAWRDPWVRRPLIAVWAGWGLLCLAYFALFLFFRPSKATNFRIVLAMQLLTPVVGLLARWLTLSRTRKHVRLEIGTLCPDCGYDLRGGQLDWRTGLADPKTGEFKCPECGAALRRVYVEKGGTGSDPRRKRDSKSHVNHVRPARHAVVRQVAYKVGRSEVLILSEFRVCECCLVDVQTLTLGCGGQVDEQLRSATAGMAARIRGEDGKINPLRAQMSQPDTHDISCRRVTPLLTAA
jgi:hypothetical protein